MKQYDAAQYRMSLDRTSPSYGPKYFYMEWPRKISVDDAKDIRDFVNLALRQLDKFVESPPVQPGREEKT